MAKKRFFTVVASILLCAIVALFYVHQEIETVKMSFRITKHRHEVSLLLDQYRSLVYNLSRLESPRRIEDSLCANEIVLCMPKVEDKHWLGRIELAYDEGKTLKRRDSFLAHVLDSFSAEAEAKVAE